MPPAVRPEKKAYHRLGNKRRTLGNVRQKWLNVQPKYVALGNNVMQKNTALPDITSLYQDLGQVTSLSTGQLTAFDSVFCSSISSYYIDIKNVREKLKSSGHHFRR